MPARPAASRSASPAFVSHSQRELVVTRNRTFASLRAVSTRNWRRLLYTSNPASLLTPVMFPPGLAMFVTIPPATGSAVRARIGMVAVRGLSARVSAQVMARIRSGRLTTTVRADLFGAVVPTKDRIPLDDEVLPSI